MGVTGLTPYLRKNAQACMQPVSNLATELNGCFCIVDSAIFVHKFAYSSDGSVSAIGEKFVEMYKSLQVLGARPLFVFDGKRLPEKAATSAKRMKTRSAPSLNPCKNTDELLENSNKRDTDWPGNNGIHEGSDKWFCDWLNKKTRELKEARRIAPPSRDDFVFIMKTLAKERIPYLIAENEAERDCALISRALTPPLRSVVITQDMDALVFGAPRVLRDVTLSCLLQYENSPSSLTMACSSHDQRLFPESQPFIVDLDMLLATLNLSMSQFIDACILCGCDFTTTRLKGYGPVRAFGAIRGGKKIEDCLPTPRPSDFEYESARSVFTMPSQIATAKVVIGEDTFPLDEWCFTKTSETSIKN